MDKLPLNPDFIRELTLKNFLSFLMLITVR